MEELLICKCGDCAHWEVGRAKGHHFLKCVTCGDVHKLEHFKIDPHDKLHYQAAHLPHNQKPQEGH